MSPQQKRLSPSILKKMPLENALRKHYQVKADCHGKLWFDIDKYVQILVHSDFLCISAVLYYVHTHTGMKC